MAIKLVTLKKNNGDVYFPKTTLEQVNGLSDALALKQDNLTTEQLEAVNSGATSTLIGKITSNEASLTDVLAVIPNQATILNQLADKDFVNFSIQTMSADLLSYNAGGDPFPTKAALDGASVFYFGGSPKTPDEHDYCVVLADEAHGGAQTRYAYSGGVWTFQYLVNDTPFTVAQNAAINSGITAEKVTEYDNVVAGMGDYLTETDAANTYATKTEVDGLGTVYVVANGADLSGYGDNDLIIELEA